MREEQAARELEMCNRGRVKAFQDQQRQHESILALAVDDPRRMRWVERNGSGTQPLGKPPGLSGETCACRETIVKGCQHLHIGDRKRKRAQEDADRKQSSDGSDDGGGS